MELSTPLNFFLKSKDDRLTTTVYFMSRFDAIHTQYKLHIVKFADIVIFQFEMFTVKISGRNPSKLDMRFTLVPIML